MNLTTGFLCGRTLYVRFAKTLWQDYTGCSLAFLTVVSVEVFIHQAIVGKLVTDQCIECCALTSLTYLTWPVCWTSDEVAHHRAVRSPLQPLIDVYLCAPTGMVSLVCWSVLQGKDPLHWLGSQSVLSTYNNNNNSNKNMQR